MSKEQTPVSSGELMIEEWRDVPGFEKQYQVSDLGNVQSLDRVTSRNRKLLGRVMSQSKHPNGYRFCSLTTHEGKTGNMFVHRMVASAFHPNPYNKKTVNHINGIKDDNRAVNLEWNTHQENVKHAFDNGLLKNCKILDGLKGEDNPVTKLSDLDCLMIKALVDAEFRREDIAKKFGVHSTHIGLIYRGLSHTTPSPDHI